MADQSSGSLSFAPPARVSEGAYYPTSGSYEKMYIQSLENPEAFWGSLAEVQIDWFHKFTKVMDCDFSHGMVAWFLGGKLMSAITAWIDTLKRITLAISQRWPIHQWWIS